MAVSTYLPRYICLECKGGSYKEKMNIKIFLRDLASFTEIALAIFLWLKNNVVKRSISGDNIFPISHQSGMQPLTNELIVKDIHLPKCARYNQY